MKTRAIYTPDMRFDKVLVFELQNNKFICITDEEIRYDIEDVIADSDWMIFSISEDDEGEYYVYNVRK